MKKGLSTFARVYVFFLFYILLYIPSAKLSHI